MSIAKCKHPVISVFRYPLPVLKQKDFTLPWSKEIKSFAYYTRPTSSRSAPDPAVTLNPGAPQHETPSLPPLTSIPTSADENKSQITLIFEQGESGIVVKKNEGVAKDFTFCSSHSVTCSEDPSTTKVKSANIWSNIKTTIATSLENGLGKNILSKLGDIRRTSSSGESSRDVDTVQSKCDRSSTGSSEPSPPKLPRVGVERRNIWESWCPANRPPVTPPEQALSLQIPPSSLAAKPNNSGETVSESEDSPDEFDQKSFLLDACSSTERSPNLPPQPLTRKLEKLSKHKRPVLVCTNSSPRPSDDSVESSPSKT